MLDIKANQQTIISEISGMDKNFAEVLRTLEKIAKSVEKSDKPVSHPASDGHPAKVTCYFTDFVTLHIMLLYRLCYFTDYVTLHILLLILLIIFCRKLKIKILRRTKLFLRPPMMNL